VSAPVDQVYLAAQRHRIADRSPDPMFIHRTALALTELLSGGLRVAHHPLALGHSGWESVFARDGGFEITLLALFCPVSHTRQALVDCQIAWREDASNAGQAYLRNRIRHQIVENLERISGQDIRQGAQRSRALLEEDATALDALSREYLKRACHGEGLALQRGTPPALLRRMIQHWLPLQGLKPLTPGNMDRLLAAWKRDERAHFSHDTTLLVYENGILRCVEDKAAPAWPETPLLPVGCVYTPGGYCLSARVQALSDVARERICSGQVDPRHEAAIDAQYCQGQTLRMRCWQPGDRYHPLGAPGSRAERSRLPLVFLKEGIVWVPGFPPADACRITPDTKTALWLTCR